MFIWFLNIFLLGAYAFLFESFNSNVKSKSYWLLFAMFVNCLILSLVKDNNTFDDIGIYLESYDYAKATSWSDVTDLMHYKYGADLDIGWALYVKLLSSITNNNLWVIFFTTTLILVSFFNCIYRYSDLAWFSILLFIAIIFYNSLFLLRQMMAAAILLWSLKFIVERSALKFFLVTSIAFSFHASAIVFIILYFIYPLKLNLINLGLYTILFALVYVFFIPVLNFSLAFVTGLSSYTGAIGDGSSSNITSVLISLAILAYCIVLNQPLKGLVGYNKLFFLMVILMVFVDLLRMGLTGTIGRINIYFHIGAVIFLTNSSMSIANVGLRLMAIVVLIALFFTTMLRQMQYGYHLSELIWGI
jgi:hypothetical protein